MAAEARRRTEDLLEFEGSKVEKATEALERYEKELLQLKDTVEGLPREVRRPIMVPFGKRAFFPGYLQHTNEILVLLGANYYVQRSATQACEIIGRRLKANSTELERLRLAREEIQKKKVLSDQLLNAQGKNKEFKMGVVDIGGGVMEIREPYEEAEKKEFDEKNRVNSSAHSTAVEKPGSDFMEFWGALGSEVEDIQITGEKTIKSAPKSKQTQSPTSKSVGGPEEKNASKRDSGAEKNNASKSVSGSEKKDASKSVSGPEKKNGTTIRSPTDLFNLMENSSRLNIVFLDIDGVVIPINYRTLSGIGAEIFDRAAMRRVVTICKACEPCEIVLSSNWKGTKEHREKVRDELMKAGWDRGFIDITPDSSVHRQVQIYHWLVENKDRVKGYLVIDDLDVARHPTYRSRIKNHFLKTIPNIGITDLDVQKSLEILQRPAKIIERPGDPPRPTVSRDPLGERLEILRRPSDIPQRSPEVRGRRGDSSRPVVPGVDAKRARKGREKFGKGVKEGLISSKPQPRAGMPEDTAEARKAFVQDARKLMHDARRLHPRQKGKVGESESSAFSGEIIERFQGSFRPNARGYEKISSSNSKTSKKKKRMSKFRAAILAKRNQGQS
ncbi:hypothetical protein AAMO2058_001188600 [Amorphochlora amoebiformis]